jgi:hypothetical protein
MADAVAEAGDTLVQPPAAAPAKDEAKAKAKKPSKPAKKGEAKGASAAGPNVAEHPRAARSIALTKSWCGLVGFLTAGYLSLPTSTLVGVGLRAIAAGAVCYVASWGAAVFVWRRLVVLEIKAREQQLVDELEARHALSPQSGGRDAP